MLLLFYCTCCCVSAFFVLFLAAAAANPAMVFLLCWSCSAHLLHICSTSAAHKDYTCSCSTLFAAVVSLTRGGGGGEGSREIVKLGRGSCRLIYTHTRS